MMLYFSPHVHERCKCTGHGYGNSEQFNLVAVSCLFVLLEFTSPDQNEQTLGPISGASRLVQSRWYSHFGAITAKGPDWAIA
jgi:hypothetical protein